MNVYLNTTKAIGFSVNNVHTTIRRLKDAFCFAPTFETYVYALVYDNDLSIRTITLNQLASLCATENIRSGVSSALLSMVTEAIPYPMALISDPENGDTIFHAFPPTDTDEEVARKTEVIEEILSRFLSVVSDIPVGLEIFEVMPE